LTTPSTTTATVIARLGTAGACEWAADSHHDPIVTIALPAMEPIRSLVLARYVATSLYGMGIQPVGA
jgi:hypothetical protein